MVELHSCAGLVNSSSLCAIEHHEMEVGVEASNGINVIEEISAELQRERGKNAQLMERISMLEAQIQGPQNKSHPSLGSDSFVMTTEGGTRKFKRQKTEESPDEIQPGNDVNGKTPPMSKPDARCIPPKDAKLEDQLVNWMPMDEKQYSHVDRLKDDKISAECDDTDESDEDEAFEEDETNANQVNGESWVTGCQPKKQGDHKIPANDTVAEKEGCQPISRSASHIRKPPKIAFCPKEVKRMLESESLLLKNAQSHTIKKIIVFASLGIRHGCDDLHELDFNHFSIRRKGEPYVSPSEPGEHVLYENPGVRRKMFYPNTQNPTLCPVKILEEEKAMRPCDPSCPSWLFLCIKYGGRTRNLPQNEYVRQRMGRNKLKSFGPLMCQMAKLVHIRSGSFFFKALGITLLFMAGFSDDLVRRETKCRNLDILQKYYRTDVDAEGEELFRQHPMTSDNQSPSSDMVIRKTTSMRSKNRKQANSTNKQPVLSSALIDQSEPSTNVAPRQYGVSGLNSAATNPVLSFQSMPSKAPADTNPIPNQLNDCSSPSVSYYNQTPYHLFFHLSHQTCLCQLYTGLRQIQFLLRSMPLHMATNVYNLVQTSYPFILSPTTGIPSAA